MSEESVLENAVSGSIVPGTVMVPTDMWISLFDNVQEIILQ